MDAESQRAAVPNGRGLCRCCLTENAKKKKYPWMSDKTEVYSSMLRDCFNISITKYTEDLRDQNGGNKNIICNECVILLKDAYQFKKQTVISENKFSDIMLARRQKRLKAMLAETERMEDNEHEVKVDNAVPAPIKYVKDGPGLCRCCLTAEGSFRELAKRYPWMSEVEVYADMLRECFNIYVLQYSEGPTGVKNLICNECVILLRDAYNFKKQIINSLKKFAEIMVARKEKKTIGFPKHEAGSSSNMECKVLEEETTYKLVSGEWQDPKNQTDPSPVPQAVIQQRNDVKTYVCETCNKSFNRKCRYLEHQLSHTGIKTFVCDECGKSFYNKDCMQKHIREVHSESKIKTDDESTQGITKKNKTFDCESCGKIFSRISALEEHKLTHGEKTFACDICRKSYYSKRKLDIHYRIHSMGRTCICDTCGQAYKWKENLINHLHTHSDTLPFVCDVCSKGFASARLLKRHLSVVHCDTKPFTCHICGAAFKEKSVMTKHLLIHKNQSYNCHICNKSFKVEHYLQVHMSSVHSERKRVSCKICEKSYKIKKYLTQHMLLVHGGARPFACHVCGKAFKLKVVLKDHLARHDKSKSFSCAICGMGFTAKSDVGRHVRKVHNKKKNNDFL